MVAREASRTWSTVLPDRFAAPSSSSSTRSVWIRPGTIMLTVMPSAARSVDSDLDHPTSAERSAFDSPRVGIGWTTPDEPTVTIRPQPAACIPGTTRDAICMTRRTIISNCFASTDRSASAIRPAGGPPVLAIRMSMPPSFSSAAAMMVSRLASSARSAATQSALPPAATILSAAASRRSAPRPVRRTCTPSAASASAMP